MCEHINTSVLCKCQDRVIDKAMMRLSRILPKIAVISRVSSVWMVVISASYFLGAHCAPHNNLGQPLFENAILWRNPCNVHSYKPNSTTITLKQRIKHLDRINETILRTKLEIDHITEDSGKDTDWDNSEQRKKYEFLHLFDKNQTTWEPRLQIYLASINALFQKQLELETAKNEDNKKSTKLRELQQNAKGLLCDLQEYKNNSKHREEHKKDTGISVEKMNSIIKFDMTQESNMDVHKWFLKCRFRCFLVKMQRHVSTMLTRFMERDQQKEKTRKTRTTKNPKKKTKKGQNINRKKNERPLKNKCCNGNNQAASSATPRPPMNRVHKVNNNKKKLNASQQPKLIKQNQKKVQRKGNKKSVQ